MADPFAGEIRAFGFNFAPYNWAFCDGSLLQMREYQLLFAVIGFTYGGDRKTTFALPDLRGRAAMHWGSGTGLTPRSIADFTGQDTVALTLDQIPAHTHGLNGGTVPGTSPQKVAVPTNAAMFSTSAPGSAYNPDAIPPVPFSPKAIGLSGGTQPHPNNQPRQSLNFCICLNGLYPPHPN